MAANVKMHEAMAINYSCIVEHDFVQAMIPHHQGAIDMCAILEVSNSFDLYLTELCQNIPRLQKAEISWMIKWLEYKDLQVGRSCFSRQIDETCSNIMPITDICHDLGGDGVCDCDELVAEGCSGSHEVAGRRFSVSTVCEESCGLCPSQPGAEEVVAGLLSMFGSTTSSHHGHSHHDTTTQIGGQGTSVDSSSARNRNNALCAVASTLIFLAS